MHWCVRLERPHKNNSLPCAQRTLNFRSVRLPAAVRGFDSRGTNSSIWTITVPLCFSSLLYDEDRYVDISDDGSTVAFSGALTTASISVLWIIDAQTGAIKFNVTAPANSGGPVMVSETGAVIAWTQGDSVAVINGTTGAVRDTVSMGWNTPAELSDDGNFLAFSGQDRAQIYTWSPATGKYALTYSVVPPGGTWYSVSCSISSDGSGAVDKELASFAWITETALGARVTTYSMVDGSLRSDWSSAVNTQLQTTPTVRSDGVYTGVALWGDNDDQPTAVILKAGSNVPIFNYTTPGELHPAPRSAKRCVTRHPAACCTNFNPRPRAMHLLLTLMMRPCHPECRVQALCSASTSLSTAPTRSTSALPARRFQPSEERH